MKPVFALILLISCSGEVVNRNSPNNPSENIKRSDYQGVKKKILILSFSDETSLEKEKLSDLVMERLIFQLENSKRFILQEKIAGRIINSREIYSSGGAIIPEIVNLAKDLGVYLLIYGKVSDAKVLEKSNQIGILSYTNMQTNASLEIRVFDVYANMEVLHEQVPTQDDTSTFKKFSVDEDSYQKFRKENFAKGLFKAVDGIIPKIISLSDRLSWRGSVAKVEGINVYLNSGKLSGLKIGDILSVVTPGNEIFDPQTGALIGTSRGIVKATIEIVDFFGSDGALANLLSGGTIHEGDQVETY